MNFSKIVSTRTAFLSETCVAPRGAVLFAGLIALAVVSTSASAQAVNFGSVNVCPAGKTTPSPCNKNETVTFNIPAGTTIGSIAILTTGIADLDYKAKVDDTSNTLCQAKTYSSATTCTVDVTFAPLAPGLRKGAVELLNGSSVVAISYIYGIGVGPQIAFTPSAQVKLGTAPSNTFGMAVDAAGNIFVTDYENKAVEEIVAAGGYTTRKSLAADVPSPGSIAVDGAGNLFVNDRTNSEVEEILAASNYTKVKKLASGQFIGSVAVDASGNLFFIDYPGIFELLAADGYTTRKTIVSSVNDIQGIAIDSAGNLFAFASAYSSIEEIMASGGYTTVKNIPIPVSVSALAVDAADNIFGVSSSGSKEYVVEIPAAGDYTSVNTLFSTYYSYEDVELLALDSSGNVFYDYVINSNIPYGFVSLIGELTRAQPPPLVYDTLVGNSSSQSVTAQNVGNAALTGSFSITGSSDFSVAAGSGAPPKCTASFSLAAGAECNLTVDFTAESSGSVTGSLVLTDDTGNENSTTQSIALSGTGATAIPQVSPASLQFGTVAVGGSASETLTIANIGTGTLTISPGSNGPSTVITGSTCGAGIGAGKSCTLQVEFRPVHPGPESDTLTIQTNGLSNPQVPNRGTGAGMGTTSSTLDFGTVTGRGNTKKIHLSVTNYGLPGNVTVATSTGAVSFKVISNGCVTGVSSGNSCVIEVEYGPATQGTQTAYLKLIPSTGPVQEIRMTGTLVP